MYGAPLPGALRKLPMSVEDIHQAAGGLRNKLGSPDLTIFFTNTMSHKMVQGALSELKGRGTIIERCHTSSLSALRGILDKYAVQGAC